MSRFFKIFLLVVLSVFSTLNLSANDTFFSIEKQSSNVKDLANAGGKVFDPVAFANYIDDIPTKSPFGSPTAPSRIYQENVAGALEYQIKNSNNVKIWADGVDLNTGKVIEAKFVSNPSASPFVEGSTCYPPVRQKIVDQVTDEFSRYSQIINDASTPLTELKVVVSDAQAVPFFEKLLLDFNIPGEVVVIP